MWARAVIHFDLDAFYASVEQQRDPALRGKPVVVGGGRDAEGRVVIGRAVVSAASYEARAFGVRSAMPLATALRLCPKAVVVPVDFPAYREASARVFAIVRDYTPLIEPLSLDEAFLDVTHSQRRFGAPEVIGAAIRDRVAAACDLHVSLGIAATKVVAKIASDLRKPRGFVVVPPGDEAATLAGLSLRRLPGLGPATETALQGLGIATLGELAAFPLDVICRRVGQSQGRSIWERAQGIDGSAVVVPTQPKSVSREETFSRDVGDRVALETRLRELAADVGRRLRAADLRGRTVTLKLRYSDFTTISRQHSVSTGVDGDRLIAQTAIELFEQTWTQTPVRLLGVGVSGFEAADQLDLFDLGVDNAAARSEATPRDAQLDRTLDALRLRFGDGIVRRGGVGPLRDLDFRGDDLRHAASSESDD